MGLTTLEKESIAHELAIFLEADSAESPAVVERATAIVVESREIEGAEEEAKVQKVCDTRYSSGERPSNISKMVKTYLYNSRTKCVALPKVPGKHKASGYRLWQKEHLKEITKYMPVVAGDREITKINRMAIHAEASSVLWGKLDAEECARYEDYADGVNNRKVTAEQQQK